jgi:crotonobetainyl-CoA:carnitine CoA-transferase CaiB-like acyl-CoA transferase
VETPIDGDLAGLFVVSLEQAVAAPYLTRRLADAGARVIKLERREGDFARGYDAAVNGLASYFVWLNHGKESICFDLKSPADIALLHNMLARADVFVQNLAPGATERAGIGSASLRERYPRLITCDITGYGTEGPYRDMKAYDLLVQAEVGLAYLTGSPAEPGRVAVSICDIGCGMTAYEGVLLALYARERTGRGRGVEASLFHSVADWMNVPYLQYRYGGKNPGRPGLHHPTIAPYGAYGCGDDTIILLSIQNEREWRRFCSDVLGNALLADDARFASNVARVEHRPALDAEIDAVFRTLTRAQVVERLEAAEIAYGRLSTPDDLIAHPQHQTIEVVTPNGTVELLAPPGVGAGTRSVFGHVPTIGEHDAAVRAEFATPPEVSR